MRTRIIWLAATAVVGVAVAGASLAIGSPGTRSSVKTIKGVARGVGQIKFVDADRDGKPSIGDYEVANVVFVAASGRRLGRGSVVCTFASAAGTRSVCQGSNHFAGGDVLDVGEFSATSRTYREAIVGGTGAYTGASGVIEGTWLDKNFQRSQVVFTLRASY